jgi:mycothiol synthase
MTGCIREFYPGDYAALVAVKNAADPEHPQSETTIRHRDDTRAEKVKFRRWLWEEDGEVLAFAYLTLMEWMFHPRKYFFEVCVHPAARSRGIGTALFEQVLAEARSRSALSLRTYTSEAWSEGLRCLEQRGFEMGPREQESALDLNRFDPRRFASDLARVEEAGELQLLTFDELTGDPDRELKVYELDKIVGPDMPWPEPPTVPDFADYRTQVFGSPQFYPEGLLLAVDEDGGYVGMSHLWRRVKAGSLATGFTGVMQEWRGKGVATALKVKVLARAKATGHGEVITSNDSTNVGMLGINHRLGFEVRPAWIDYTMDLDNEES